MDSPPRLLVLADPNAHYLGALESIRSLCECRIGVEPEWAASEAPLADIILAANFGPQPFRAIFPKATKVRWVHSVWAGVEQLLSPEFVASSVPLTNGRGAFSEALAEYAIAAMLYFAKDLQRLRRSQTAQKWQPFAMEFLKGKTLGIVGYGEIGRATAQRAAALGMRVLALRRRVELTGSDAYLTAVFAPNQLKEMLPEVDYLFLAAPNTPETRGMIGAAELALLRSTAVLINVGRGSIFDEQALADVLAQQKIRGAALDVFVKEPLPEDHLFYSLENVLLSPHTADNYVGWIENAMSVFLGNFHLFLKGSALTNLVDKSAGY